MGRPAGMPRPKVVSRSQSTVKTRNAEIRERTASIKMLAAFHSLPKHLQEAVCTCTNPKYEYYSTLLEKPMPYGPNYPYGSYCTECLKPYIYSIWKVAKLCEGCDTYYVPRAERGQWPVRWNLCPSCD